MSADYGPNAAAVGAFIERCRTDSGFELDRLAAAMELRPAWWAPWRRPRCARRGIRGAKLAGRDAAEAAENARAVELVAAMAARTLALAPDARAMPERLRMRHFERKHGPHASYGQPQVDG